jgi:beta-galactosidase
MQIKELLFGAAYYDEYMPYDRVDEDMRLMKAAGMNVIRIAESTWSTWEPQDNIYDFTHLHRMMKAAVKHDIKVIIGTPTYAIPSWLAKKHPEIMSFNKNGQEIYGHRQLTDITNPDYLFHAERIIRHLMEEIKDYPNVIGFQLDNETRSAGAASPRTQALFVARMREKYPDIKDFNHEFGLDYWSNRIDSWEDFPDIRGTINGSLSAAYKRFLRDCITEFLTWQAKILREYMTPGQFITHNFDYSWIEYSFGIQPEVNQFDAAQCMDVAGVDIYHLSQDDLDGSTIAFGGAVGRSLKKDNYLVLETQSQGKLSWLPYPGQLRLQAFSHLASGANSVMYWNWHSIHNSFESYWKGILSHDLQPHATYRELAAFGKEVRNIEVHLLNLKKTCRAAIIVNNESLTGLEEFPISDDFGYNNVVRWMYDACYEINLECDILSVQDNFEGYTLLFVPALYSASDETITKLKEYTKQGGHMILGFKSGFSDDELKIYSNLQPHGLTECIGASYDQFTRPANVSLQYADSDVLYHVSEWMELICPDSADVWASYIHPYWGKYAAVTHNKYGAGTATYVGCYMEKSGLKTLIKRICKVSGISLPDYEFPIIRKEGINDLGKRVHYYFNYSSEMRSFVYDGEAGYNLLDNQQVKPQNQCVLKAWDLMIVEEA